MQESEELYREIILDHSKHPRNYDRVLNLSPVSQAKAKNPICGDEYQVSVSIDQENIIRDIAFTGHGCAVSKASASIMTELLKGQSVVYAKALRAQVEALLLKGEISDVVELNAFSGLKDYPDRIHCAILAWQILDQIIAE